MKKELHLVCNAHLDPVWLWEWEEGAAAAIATFRVAADFCEEYDGFVFNHNEAILYRWIEEYEPALFERIQRLVAAGKWHIMGGWYLQPDCNMPSGESFARQIISGRSYFRRKFNAEPTTAINFDPFGHTRGLVQILKKSGYDSYLFCRPFQNDCPLPSDDFTWVGFDGSEITGHRAQTFYNQPLGKAREKVEKWIADNPEKPVGIVLWGVGNHGGGPSRQDLERLADLMAKSETHDISHSTPEQYFGALRACGAPLPRHESDINPWAPGCYTSQIRIKQKHRLLENMLYQVEKMASAASLEGLMEYPGNELHDAQDDLLEAQFHDILPGSSIQPVEDAALRLMDHGLEMLSRVRARSFFALASGQPAAAEDRIPILVYNPHPYPVRAVVECEFQLADVNWEDSFTVPIVHAGDRRLPCQTEQELSNLNVDWRKRAVFLAELAPSQMNRFDCALELLPERPKPRVQPRGDCFEFRSDDLEVDVNRLTGLVDRYAVGGRDYLKPQAFKLLVIDDNEDPWGMTGNSFRNVIGEFKLLSAEETTEFAGVTESTLEPVRVIEDGAVRTVIEAIFTYNHSFAVVHYKLPKTGGELEIALRAHWNEKNKMLKLSAPTVFDDAAYWGQVAYGAQQMPENGREVVAQKWTAVVSDTADAAFTCINNGTYGSDFCGGEMRLSLLRGAAYSGHPIGERSIVPQDRHTPRIDQGERMFRFWFRGGGKQARLDAIDREALVKNEQPFALSFFPHGDGTAPKPLVTLSDDAVQLAAFKKAEDSDDYVLRLFEPTGQARATTIGFPGLGFEKRIEMQAFEIKTLRLNSADKTLTETDILER